MGREADSGVIRWIAVLIFLYTISTTSAQRTFVTVETKSGKVKGETIDVLGKKVNRFWGIPYATPPLGDIRFKPTTMIDPWTETLDALDRPASCHQLVDEMFGKFKGVNMWNPNTKMSEDCLKLNIYAPKTGAKNMTTMVWIFGGSFNAGTSTLDVYDPRYLAAENDVIVVTLNYRFGPFGFLYFGHEDAPGNIGLLDQRLAFKWLYENIESFGGSKDMISLFGESSGAVSISLHLLSPKSWPYFNNAILQSGAYNAHWAFQTQEEAKARAYKLAGLVKCNKTEVKETIKCLRGVDPANLTLLQWNLPSSSFYFDTTVAPTVDGNFLEDYPDVLARKKLFKNTNLLAGVNSDEASYFLIYGMSSLFPDAEPTKSVTENELTTAIGTILEPMGNNRNRRETVIYDYRDSRLPSERPSNRDVIENFAGDFTFKCPTLDFSRLYTMSTGDVYVYHYAHRSSFNPWPLYAGIMHGYEIDMVFGQPLNDTLGYTDDEVVFSRKVMKLWTNFAKTGNPNKDSKTSQAPDDWPKFDNSSLNYYLINSTGSDALEGLRHRQCVLLGSLLPKIGATTSEKDKAKDCTSAAVTDSPTFLVALVMTILLVSAIPYLR